MVLNLGGLCVYLGAEPASLMESSEKLQVNLSTNIINLINITNNSVWNVKFL